MNDVFDAYKIGSIIGDKVIIIASSTGASLSVILENSNKKKYIA